MDTIKGRRAYVHFRYIRVTGTGWLQRDGTTSPVPYAWGTVELAEAAMRQYRDPPKQSPEPSEAELAAMSVEGW